MKNGHACAAVLTVLPSRSSSYELKRIRRCPEVSFIKRLIRAVLQTDYDMVDYLNELREGCLEAYTGIIQGLKGDQENVHRKFIRTSSCRPAFSVFMLNRVFPPAADVMLIQPRVEFILSFIHHIAEDEDRSDGVVANAVGLIG